MPGPRPPTPIPAMRMASLEPCARKKDAGARKVAEVAAVMLRRNDLRLFMVSGFVFGGTERRDLAGERLIEITDYGFCDVALVENQAVGVGAGFARSELHRTVVLWQCFVHSAICEGVGSEEAVVASVPAVRVSRGGGVFHEGDGVGLSVDGP